MERAAVIESSRAAPSMCQKQNETDGLAAFAGDLLVALEEID